MSETADYTNAGHYSKALHVVACVTFVTALLPIAFGAQTTTEGAGMAFPDYPTSDGEGMLEYNLFEATRAQFLEHGHRLAGMLVGVAALTLCGAGLILGEGKLVKGLCVGALLAVIAQGLLGGVRVLRENTDLAALHGFTASLTLALIGMTAVVTSRRWQTQAGTTGPLTWTKRLGVAAAVLVAGQYLLGGQMRHFGYSWAQTGHLHLSFWAFAATVAAGVAAIRSGSPWVRKAGVAVHAVVTAQMLLGFATWAQKYGVAFAGYVAQPLEPATLYLRSAHMIVGAVLVAAIATLLARTWRAAGTLGGQGTSVP